MNTEFIFPSIKKILSDIRLIISLRVENKYQLYLFLSRVSGDCPAKSDIDIRILAEDKIQLSLLTEIRNELENINTLLKIESVDLASVSDNFKNFALDSAI